MLIAAVGPLWISFKFGFFGTHGPSSFFTVA